MRHTTNHMHPIERNIVKNGILQANKLERGGRLPPTSRERRPTSTCPLPTSVAWRSDVLVLLPVVMVALHVGSGLSTGQRFLLREQVNGDILYQHIVDVRRGSCVGG